MDDATAPVTITFQVDNQTTTIDDCELLIIGCDPRPLISGIAGLPVMSPLGDEAKIFGAFTEFVFQTTLVTVNVPSAPSARPKYGAILDTATGMKMNGDVSAFRNESAKQYSVAAANQLDKNHVVLYQLWGQDDPPNPLKPRPSQEELLAKLISQLQDPNQVPWWPYGRTYTKDYKLAAPPLHSSYFHHFTRDDVKRGLQWDLLNLQGHNRTVYVWAGTCFESALQCWQYQEFLLQPTNPHHITLPASPNARIVIVGAGVSGILMADRLTRLLGHTNVTVLERENRVAGKAHSIKLENPHPTDNPEPTICELGTCYMSPAYDEFVTFLRPFTDPDEMHPPNDRRGFPLNPPGEFRGMVTTGMIKGFPTVVDYTDYLVLRYQQKEGQNPDPSKRDEVLEQLGLLLLAYAGQAWDLIGRQLPMPTDPLDPETMKTLGGTYQAWIDSEDHIPSLTGLSGLLEYAYSNQGYGPLPTIAAYYGLIWMSPLLAERLALQAYENLPLVTCWSRGWEAVWQRMAEPLNVVKPANILSITRNVSPRE